MEALQKRRAQKARVLLLFGLLKINGSTISIWGTHVIASGEKYYFVSLTYILQISQVRTSSINDWNYGTRMCFDEKPRSFDGTD
jgi:hypothetical protein